MSDISDMVRHQLKLMGADGLVAEDGLCSCTLDELFPCDAPQASCLAGKFSACHEDCFMDCGDEPHIEVIK